MRRLLGLLRSCAWAGATAMCMLPALPIAAQAAAAFPVRAVKIVVPFAAGGTTDITARLMSERLATLWGKLVVINVVAGRKLTHL